MANGRRRLRSPRHIFSVSVSANDWITKWHYNESRYMTQPVIARPSLSIDYPVPHFVQVMEEPQIERLLQERDAAGAAGAGLHADDALHRADMIEAPALEQHLHVHQLFREVIELPVVAWAAIDGEPRRDR